MSVDLKSPLPPSPGASTPPSLTYPPRSVPVDSRTTQTTRGAHSATPSSISMSEIRPPSDSEAELLQQPMFELAPIDRGKAAWTFVGCSFVMEMLVIGLPSSFGTFQEYYLNHAPFDASSESMINSIGTIALALQYAINIVAIGVYQRYPQWSRTLKFGSLATCSLALLLAGFCTTVWGLVLTQGVMFGLGGAFLYAPVLIYLSQWFVQRRAFAASVIFAGTAVGGGIFPFLIDFLLTRLGLRKTMCILSALIFGAGICSVAGVRSRVPIIAPMISTTRSRHGQSSGSARNYDLRVFRKPLYIVVSLTIMAQSFGYYPVPFYISTYATEAGLSTTTGTLALAVFNLSTVVGQLVAGSLCDWMGYSLLMVWSAAGSAMAAYLIWGFAHTAGMIYLFAVAFGSISGGFNSSYSSASSDLAEQNVEEVSMIFGTFGLFKSIAIIGGPLISSVLHNRSTNPMVTAAMYGAYGFKSVILFVGSVLAATSCGGLLSMFLRARGR